MGFSRCGPDGCQLIADFSFLIAVLTPRDRFVYYLPMSLAVDETVIPLSKTKLVFAVVGSAAFIVVSVWCFHSIDPSHVHTSGVRSYFETPNLNRALLSISALVFTIFGVYGIKKLFDRKPGLILNSLGITDNSSAASVGFIPWSDVEGFNVYGVRRSSFLVLLIREPEKYLNSSSLSKRLLNKSNFKMYGSPITIASAALSISSGDLRTLLERYLTKYGEFDDNRLRG